MTARAQGSVSRHARVTIVYWRDIPAQVIVGSGRRGAKVPLPERFEQAIDRCRDGGGASGTDAYLAGMAQGAPRRIEGAPDDVARAEAARLEAEYDPRPTARARRRTTAGRDPRTDPRNAYGDLLPFRRATAARRHRRPRAASCKGYSIEVMPRTAAKVEDFRAAAAAGHAGLHRPHRRHADRRHGGDGATARRRGLRRDAARSRAHHCRPGDAGALDPPLCRARRGSREALLLAGGVAAPARRLPLLDAAPGNAVCSTRDGFTRLHVAGHPEGNRDIDPDGSDANVAEALRWKDDFARRTDARMALVTQFASTPTRSSRGRGRCG